MRKLFLDAALGGKNSSGNVANLRRLPAYKWLVENAACFGFYPYNAEPWHWEYNPPAGSAGRDKVPHPPKPAGKPSASGVDQNVIRRIAQYDDLIDRVATEEGVNPNIVRGIIAAESGGRANLEARSGYKGLMQAGTKPDQFDPEISVRTGVRKFKMFRDRWLGPRLRNLGIDIRSLEREAVVRWVATAYNAGHRTVLKAVEYALAAGNANLWMQPEHFQRALLYTGAYSVRQAAPSCLQGRSDPQLVARALQENQRLRGRGITVEQARTIASPLLLCAVEFKHRNLPRYVNRIIAYMRYYDRIRPAQLREVVFS